MPASTSQTLDIAIIGAAHPHVEYVLSEIANRTDVRVVAVADYDAARRAEPRTTHDVARLRRRECAFGCT